MLLALNTFLIAAVREEPLFHLYFSYHYQVLMWYIILTVLSINYLSCTLELKHSVKDSSIFVYNNNNLKIVKSNLAASIIIMI